MQALPLLGASGATGGPMGAARALPAAVSGIDIGAFAVGAVTLAVGFLWPRRFSRFAPGPLVALAAGTALGVLWFTETPVIGAIPAGLPTLHLGLPSADFLPYALQPAVILALLGSVDSLLTSLVADSLTGNRHNPDRELIGPSRIHQKTGRNSGLQRSEERGAHGESGGVKAHVGTQPL